MNQREHERKGDRGSRVPLCLDILLRSWRSNFLFMCGNPKRIILWTILQNVSYLKQSLSFETESLKLYSLKHTNSYYAFWGKYTVKLYILIYSYTVLQDRKAIDSSSYLLLTWNTEKYSRTKVMRSILYTWLYQHRRLWELSQRLLSGSELRP